MTFEELFDEMIDQGTAATPETWPSARRVEVARDVLIEAGVLDLLEEVQELREVDAHYRHDTDIIANLHRTITKLAPFRNRVRVVEAENRRLHAALKGIDDDSGCCCDAPHENAPVYLATPGEFCYVLDAEANIQMATCRHCEKEIRYCGQDLSPGWYHKNGGAQVCPSQ